MSVLERTKTNQYFQMRVEQPGERVLEEKFAQRDALRRSKISPEQAELDEAVRDLNVGQAISLFVCSQAEYNDETNADEIARRLTNYRGMITHAVKEAGYPRIAGTKRFAYQTITSLENDGNYWLLFRRLSPISDSRQTR
jgi:hypothetical protein